MTTDPIKALLDLKALAEAATPGPWEWHDDNDDIVFGPYTLGTDGPDLRNSDTKKSVLSPFSGQDTGCLSITDEDKAFIAAANPKTILAAIEALRPMADVVMENERLNARIKVFESSEYQARLEGLASDVFRLQAENHELKKRPASPAPVDGERVERVARALVKQGLFYGNGECLFEVDDAMDLARAALAAINGEQT